MSFENLALSRVVVDNSSSTYTGRSIHSTLVRFTQKPIERMVQNTYILGHVLTKAKHA